ncbi:3-phosphoshikimate 1-carboxyvinyltransferase [Winogradskyella litorisediminis]|uniref:3-phosphoshikimate 1-carboxyvinyltransferase n=1 Tax=Winogradskyella litorisediminis TaxID=1156618 RepID=A0ABW3N8X5_9FLAO
MTLHLQKSTIQKRSSVEITGSKSEANRLLILQALYPEISINNVSNSDDSQLMQKALASKENVVDIHHAGTAMRFLTAYFSAKKDREVVLTGSQRMKERPIKILVDALKDLGADISYVENEGFPPLKIKGKILTKSKVTLKADVSSQYISALLLIGSSLENGLQLTLDGKITSVPYIKMTLSLLNEIGIENTFVENTITVKQKQTEVKPQILTVESDWSSASYFYSIVALSDLGIEVKLSSYKENSLQGDSVLAEIYKQFGVSTTFQNNSILLQKTSIVNNKTKVNLDLSNAPDIAQTISVTAFGLGLQCHLTGLHTLKIKETDRLVALQNELRKFGAEIEITNDSLTLEAHNIYQSSNNSFLEKFTESISTYNDHRMAMAFAPLALKQSFIIENADVVSKSYPDFWSDLNQIGFIFK